MKINIIRTIRFLYELVPFKIYFLRFLRLFYQPSDFMVNQLYFSGSFRVNYKGNIFKMKCHNLRGFTIENKLFWYGTNTKMKWEKQSTDLWSEIALKSKVILDIGANTGYYSLIAKTINSNAKVFGFEPIPHIYKWYAENCKINSFEIDCFNVAVSDTSGEDTIYLANTTQNIYSASLIEDFAVSHSRAKVHPLKITSISLKDFIIKNNIECIDLMKIDVEGLELKVLNGMGIYLNEFRPSILIEVLSDETGNELSNLLIPLEYQFYKLCNNDLPKRVERISANSSYNFFVCQKEVAQQLSMFK